MANLEGDKAPNFTLRNENNNEITLTDYKGKKVILYFYPKDDTPGCTKESNEFSELSDKFKLKNTEIIGISKDSVESHKKFKEKYNLKVTLVSDPEMEAIQAYGVWKEKKNYGKTYMGIVRTTVLINEEGKIEKRWNNVKVNGHCEKVLEAIK